MVPSLCYILYNKASLQIPVT